jgi:transposase
MDIHQNARLTPRGRAELVRRVLGMGQAPKTVAGDLGVAVKTVRKWCTRFQAEGAAGLRDRSSRPHRRRQPTPDAIVQEIAVLRRQRWTGDQIAKQVDVSPATVSRVLRRLGLSRLKDLMPAAPITNGPRPAS